MSGSFNLEFIFWIKSKVCFCEIGGSKSSVDEDSGLPGCEAVLTGK
jgi:hypothetical protein